MSPPPSTAVEPSRGSTVVRRAVIGEKTATDVLEPNRVVRDPSDIEPWIGEERRRRKKRGRVGKYSPSPRVCVWSTSADAIVAVLTKLRVAAILFGLSANVSSVDIC